MIPHDNQWRMLAGVFGTSMLMAVMVPATSFAQDLAITHVQPSTTHIDPKNGKALQIRFSLTAPAHVTLRIYDGREILIRAVESPTVMPKGEHHLTWDLRDHRDQTIPPEAYIYTLEARSEDGKRVLFDLADSTGAETLIAQDVKWNAQRGKLTYVLDQPSRVAVRLGMTEGGPLLRTLLDWVVRPAGLQQEEWDGMDASGVLDLSHHPKLAISVHAFSLPENSILVGAPQKHVKLVEQLPSEVTKRSASLTRTKRMYAHSQQPLEARGDFNVHFTLPETLTRSSAGLPIVSETIPVRLDVDASDRKRALARRFEPVFFVDGQFVFENEVGFVPMTWNFDPSALNEGEHFLTVNLRGYEGNFGMATLKILVQRHMATHAERWGETKCGSREHK